MSRFNDDSLGSVLDRLKSWLRAKLRDFLGIEPISSDLDGILAEVDQRLEKSWAETDTAIQRLQSQIEELRGLRVPPPEEPEQPIVPGFVRFSQRKRQYEA